MNHIKSIIVASAFALLAMPASAQLNRLINKAKDAVEKNERTTTMTQNQTAAASPQATGKSYYVSPAGSNRNDALTPQTAVKDLQKAIDLAEEGSVINIAEGNYLGKLDQGFVEVKKYLSLVGGWNSDFSERNPVKYITSIRPGAQQVGTSGSHASLEVMYAENVALLSSSTESHSTRGSTTAIAAMLRTTPAQVLLRAARQDVF